MSMEENLRDINAEGRETAIRHSAKPHAHDPLDLDQYSVEVLEVVLGILKVANET
jgi:hypothetical protein